MMVLNNEDIEGLDVDRPSESINDVRPITLNAGLVSVLHKCKSSDAKELCIHDAAQKLLHSGHYDIGGTYTNNLESEMWFYYTTSVCPGYNYLLNLFVCHRKSGNFTLGVSKSNEIIHKKSPNQDGKSSLSDNLTWYKFCSEQPNENHYIKTFCLSEKDLKALEMHTLYIPLSLDTSPRNKFDMDIVRRIKLEHDFSKLFPKQEKTDFVLESVSKKKYPAHKIVLAAHSTVLRDIVKNAITSHLDIDDHDMGLLLEFMYTGTIKNISTLQESKKLLELADKFQMKTLFLLAQFAISEHISVQNAVEIAVISEKYKLERLQYNTFNFIKKHPEVVETPGWNNLNDVVLAKKLFQYTQKDSEPRASKTTFKDFRRLTSSTEGSKDQQNIEIEP